MKFHNPFRKPSPKELAQRELEEAQRELLVAQSAADYARRIAEYNADRTRPRMTVSGATAYFLGNRLGTTGTGAYAGLAGIPNGLPVYKLNLDRFYGAITPEDYASMSTQVTYDAQSENSLANFSITQRAAPMACVQPSIHALGEAFGVFQGIARRPWRRARCPAWASQ